jgi:hypothetical protein
MIEIRPMSREEIEYYRQRTDTPYYSIREVTLGRLIATIDERDREIQRLKAELATASKPHTSGT